MVASLSHVVAKTSCTSRTRPTRKSVDGRQPRASSSARIQPLQRHAVGPGGVEDEPAAVADDVRHGVGGVGDRQVRAAAEVDRRRHRRSGRITNRQASARSLRVEELPSRRPRAPDGQLRFAAPLRLVQPARMRAGMTWPLVGTEVVVRAEGVGRDGRDETGTVLPAVGLAQLPGRPAWPWHRPRWSAPAAPSSGIPRGSGCAACLRVAARAGQVKELARPHVHGPHGGRSRRPAGCRASGRPAASG